MRIKFLGKANDKKKLMIRDLTPVQYKEYMKIAQLNNQGKFKEFSIEVKKFKKKHNLR